MPAARRNRLGLIQARAQALGAAPAARSSLEPDFGANLRQLHAGAKLIFEAEGGVRNSISGGNLYGPVLQGRNLSGLSFSRSRRDPAHGAAVPTQL
ncbi:hypothetical protein [Streptomyces broussonetiae]|uniref:Uncharacterized protein n=1 Tax=Streptomyces broussonetiae TaxID=2686304 RepID=A0ABV5EAP0_9ACTN